jgi:hypothetical protein
LFEKPVLRYAAAVRSPKSVALPALAKVKYSITFNAEEPYPPATIDLVSELKPAPSYVLLEVSPKSVALPADTGSILSTVATGADPT